MESQTEKSLEEMLMPAKAKARPLPEPSDPCPQPPSILLFSGKDERKGQQRASRKTQEPKAN